MPQAASEVELDLEARPSRGEGGYELSVSGRARGLPDGATVRLRFRRVMNRVEGEGRVIKTGPVEASWVRRVAVRRGAYAHCEVLAAPVEVEVEAAYDPAEQERPESARGREPVAVVKVFRGASPIETAASLRREARAVRETLAEACRFAGGAGKERAVRKLAALREEEPRALFSATVSLLAGVLEDYLSSAAREIGAHGPGARVLGLRGRSLPEALEEVREVYGRERAVLVAKEVGRLGREGAPERVLGELRGAAAGGDALLAFLQAAEDCLLSRQAGREGDGGLAELAAAVEARAREGR